MPTAVRNFSQEKLSNAFHASFHHIIITQLVEVGDENIGLPAGFTSSYQSTVQAEQDIVNRTYGSANTEALHEQDTLRVNYYRSILNTLANTKYSAVVEVKQLYPLILKKLLKPYPKLYTRQSNFTKSSRIRGLIFDLNQFLTESQRQKIGITAELAAMEAANEAYESIFLNRVDEYVANPAGLTEKCRKNVDEHWEQFVRSLNYYANETANPSSEIAAFATNALAYLDNLNKFIDEFLRSVEAASRNKSRSKDDNSEQSSDDNDNDNNEQSSDDNGKDNNSGMGGDL